MHLQLYIKKRIVTIAEKNNNRFEHTFD